LGSGGSGGDGRGWCGESGARAVPFIGAREGEGREGTASADELAMKAGMEQTATGWLWQARGEGTARVQWRGVAEAGASVNGEVTGREAVGGERAGDGMGETMVLTGGPGLLVGERRDMESGGAVDRWGRAVRHGAGARSWAAWDVGGGGEAGAARFGPKTAQPMGGKGFSFFFFYFLFHFSISYFCFFLFLFLLNQQFAK
jgi:hypothetical protein